MDPLVYGTELLPSFTTPIDWASPLPPHALTSFSVPPPPELPSLPPDALTRDPVYASYRGRPEITVDEWREKDDHTNLLSHARRIKQQQKREAKVRKRTYASAETTDTIDAHCRAARDEGLPRICLYVPRTLEAHVLDSWNQFCSGVDGSDARVFHCFHADQGTRSPVAICNALGRVLTIDDDWFRFFAVNGGLGVLTVLAKMTDSHILQNIGQLPEGGRVLVYDFANVRCMQEMIQWRPSETHFVMPLGDTGFPGPCVVEREQEILAIHNI